MVPADPLVELQLRIRGEVSVERIDRLLYSTDAGVHQVVPAGVVRPRDADEVAAVVAWAAQPGVPLTARPENAR